ncbi:hypothetical protein WR25_14218 [Diploscapter pachys]|uniref:Kringle domain-containing protein n=1 Tax=Diploscapter pachys TaxID=2018661 RepID=A0A2A2LMF1_9BILA|nr:hypothetical protein WR25_14218 [Diploscapter pachys]
MGRKLIFLVIAVLKATVIIGSTDFEWLEAEEHNCGQKCVEDLKNHLLQDREKHCLNTTEANRFLGNANWMDASTPIPEERTRLPTRFGQELCVTERNSRMMITTIRPTDLSDYRIVCRPVQDTMTWYRGWHAISITNKPCLRWDSIAELPFSESNFSRFSRPSVNHETSLAAQPHITRHENFCRNPNNHQLGPWCYVYRQGSQKPVPEPCFHPCVDSIKSLCLSKRGYPYHQDIDRPADSSEVFNYTTISERVLLTKNTKGEKQDRTNRFVDLHDMLDVKDVMKSIPDAMPLTSNLVYAYFSNPSNRVMAHSNRVRCHQTGYRTRVAGPWTPVHFDNAIASETLSILKNRLLTHRARISPDDSLLYTDLSVEKMGAGANDANFWTPCFSGCADATLSCWPNTTQFTNFKYFGGIETDLNNRECIAWSVVFAKANDTARRRRDGAKQTSQISASDKDSLFLFIDALVSDPWSGTAFVKTTSIESYDLQYLVSKRCLNLSQFLEFNDYGSLNLVEAMWNKIGELNVDRKSLEKWAELMESIENDGPGCFVKSENLIKWSPCFLPCTSESLTPADPIRKLCEGKDGTFETCVKEETITSELLRGRKIASKGSLSKKPDISIPSFYWLVLANLVIGFILPPAIFSMVWFCFDRLQASPKANIEKTQPASDENPTRSPNDPEYVNPQRSVRQYPSYPGW